jgi:hypothetical protein
VSSATVALRRTALLVVLAALIGAVVSWRRGSRTLPELTTPPVWPPIESSARIEEPAPSSEPTSPEPTSPEPASSEPTWKPADVDGSTPAGYPVKAKDASQIFHEPGGRFYDRTKPDRCYRSAADAEADGYRRSKT